MASSPASTSETRALLELVLSGYQAAISALADSDVETVREHLDKVDELTARLTEFDQDGQLGPVEPELVRQVEDTHARLCQLVSAEKSTLSKQLQQSTLGRRALRSYGNKASATGNYHRSDA